MKDRYSLLAPWYSSLVKLIFGEKLKESKLCLLAKTGQKRVLIIGGGDGLDYQGFQNRLDGEYWEISNSMLTKAKVNLAASNLRFHLGFFQAQKGKLFDEVWLHFVLDTMLDDEIVTLLGEINKSLSPGGELILADFFGPKSTYQHFLQAMMITLFRLVVNHKRENLPDYDEILLAENWGKVSERQFMKGWVKAQKWKL